MYGLKKWSSIEIKCIFFNDVVYSPMDPCLVLSMLRNAHYAQPSSTASPRAPGGPALVTSSAGTFRDIEKDIQHLRLNCERCVPAQALLLSCSSHGAGKDVLYHLLNSMSYSLKRCVSHLVDELTYPHRDHWADLIAP